MRDVCLLSCARNSKTVFVPTLIAAGLNRPRWDQVEPGQRSGRFERRSAVMVTGSVVAARQAANAAAATTTGRRRRGAEENTGQLYKIYISGRPRARS